MTLKEECMLFRQAYDSATKLVDVNGHSAACTACRRWCAEVDALAQAVAAIPQFDVPEQLTQRIIGALETDAARVPLFGNGLFMPLGIACAALSLSILPVDSMEGLISTAIGLACLWVLQAFISIGKVEGAEVQG